MCCVHSVLATYGVVSGVEVGCEEMAIIALHDLIVSAETVAVFQQEVFK